MITIYTWKNYHASAMFEIIQSQRVMEIWVGINAFKYGIGKIRIAKKFIQYKYIFVNLVYFFIFTLTFYSWLMYSFESILDIWGSEQRHDIKFQYSRYISLWIVKKLFSCPFTCQSTEVFRGILYFSGIKQMLFSMFEIQYLHWQWWNV